MLEKMLVRLGYFIMDVLTQDTFVLSSYTLYRKKNIGREAELLRKHVFHY